MSVISEGRAVLGIELGSTRIKACLIDPDTSAVLATGSHAWESRLVEGLWSYSLDEVWEGLRAAYSDLADAVESREGSRPSRFGAIGVSAMMHGYLAFDAAGELLVPFRTWRNTNTTAAAERLTEEFGENIPLRWSIAHYYQAALDGEAHVPSVDFFTTLSGYVHWRLTGERVLGVGDASGMFPIDAESGDFDAEMLARFDALVPESPGSVAALMPRVLSAGEPAGSLTEEGARLLDPTGGLVAGIPMCPPEGDAGTGMV
ncbi:FGGY family carbohydrate kinase, partial [Leucobacter ruminantium]